MKKASAKAVSELMVATGAALNESVWSVQQSESAEDFKRYRDAVSKIMSTMLLEIMNPLYADHPDLKPPGLD